MVDNFQIDNDNTRIVQSFFAVGLNAAKITKYCDEENHLEFLQKIDIYKSQVLIKTPIFRPKTNEKWQAINKNTWLRLEYNNSYDRPITGLKIIDCEILSDDFLLISKKEIDYGYKPLNILYPNQNQKENPEICWEYDLLEKYDENYFKIPGHFNIKNFLKINNKANAAILGIKRKFNALALKDATIITDKSGIHRIGVYSNKDPSEFRYLPELIDVYPLNSGIEPSIGMLCFPEGVSIKKKPDNPRWFSFIQTNTQYKKYFCSVLTFMEELTNEYVDSFVPVYYTKEKLYVEKAICIMGNYPFFHNYKMFLRELYRLQTSNYLQIPLERIICHFVDSLFLQPEKCLTYKIGTEELKFYNQPIYAQEWDLYDDCIEILFTVLSIENIISLWQAMLLERQIFLLSKSKTILNQICLALTTLLFPFKWNHVFIPVLPLKCKGCVDAFVPLIMGISFNIDLNDLPEDSLVVNIETNQLVKNNEKIPKLPSKLAEKFVKKIEKYKYKYNNPVDVLKIQYCDEVFNYCDTTEGKDKFNTQEIRNSFFEFFISMFSMFEKYFIISKKCNLEGEIEPVLFNRDVFLKEHGSQDQNSFLFRFTETNIFAALVDGFSEKEPNFQLQFFTDIIKNKKKDKQHLNYIVPIINTHVEEISLKDIEKKVYVYNKFPKMDPNLYVKIEKPIINYQSRFEIAKDEWCYNKKNLSNHDWAKYIVYSIHEIWFFFLSTLLPTINDAIAPRLMEYALFLIDELKSEKITPTRSLYTKIIRSCCRSTLESYVNTIFSMMPQNYKINNPLYYSEFMNGLYDDFSQMRKKTNSSNNLIDMSIDLNDKMNGLLRRKNNFGGISGNEIFNNNLKKNVNFLIKSSIFVPYEFCVGCFKSGSKSPKKLSFIDIIAGFKRNLEAEYTVCNICFTKVFPKLYIIFENQTNLENIEITNLMSPIKLLNEIDLIIQKHGDKYFFLGEYYNQPKQREVFWNILFYFQLFNLPTVVMSLQTDIIKLRAAVDEMNTNIEVVKKQMSMYVTSTQQSLSVMKTITDNESNNSDNDSSHLTSPTTNFNNNEKVLQNQIIEIFEKNIIHIEREKSTDDRKDLLNQNFHLKQVIGKFVEEFDRKQKIKFDSLYRGWEISDELETAMQMKDLFDNPNIILRESRTTTKSGSFTFNDNGVKEKLNINKEPINRYINVNLDKK